jgi:hypothetical protein
MQARECMIPKRGYRFSEKIMHKERMEVHVVRSIAIAMVFAAMAPCACAEAASAKKPHARQSVAHRSTPLPKNPPVARTPVQGEKSWMDRASAPSSSGGGGGSM